MLRNLNGFTLNFCSFEMFHWYLITDFIISKDFCFGSVISASLYSRGSSFFWRTRSKIIKSMKSCMNKELYIRRANTINCGCCDKKQDKSTESIFVTFLSVSQFIFNSRVGKFIFNLKSFKIREIEWFSVRTIGLFRTQ